MLEGFRREVAVNELCRREGIKPGAYYAWTKDFMEAGKERLTRDTIRDATRQEIEQINAKQLYRNYYASSLSNRIWLKPTTISSSMMITGTLICPDFCVISLAFSLS